MDTYEFNKIAGAILGTVLLIMLVQNVADILYEPHHPTTPGYSVEVADEGHGTTEEVVEETISMAAMMAGADADSGASVAKKCTACHTFEEGGANRIGPNLYGILGRAAGSVDGFSYSSAMQERAAEIGTWDYESLNAFLLDPKGYITGTKMAFAGLRRDNQRADMLMYLRAQSASPMPLPVEEDAGDAAGEDEGSSE